MVAVAMPVPVSVTFAVDVEAIPPVTYCTLIVQLAPGARTVPEAQVPPAMIEKVPVELPVALVIVGAAVRVSAPVAAAELVTVIKPVFVATVGGVEVSVG